MWSQVCVWKCWVEDVSRYKTISSSLIHYLSSLWESEPCLKSSNLIRNRLLTQDDFSARLWGIRPREEERSGCFFDVGIMGLCVSCQQNGPLWLQIHPTHFIHSNTHMAFDVSKQGLFHENQQIKSIFFQIRDSFIVCDSSPEFPSDRPSVHSYPPHYTYSEFSRWGLFHPCDYSYWKPAAGWHAN